MPDVPEQIQRAIREHRLLQNGDSFIVAVSGGLDSMVLLHLLHRLSRGHGWRPHVAHFNHMLRGESSEGDEAFVRETAEKLRLPFFVDRADVREFAEAESLSLEMAARQVRHKFLARVAQEHEITKIALAHHADDQVELFFLRLLRGTSLDGLSGMQWSSPSPVDAKIQLVRPLLECSKSDLRECAQKHKVAFREDATNESRDILRNRIRHELLPLLQAHYQPAIMNTTLRLMEIIRAESELNEEIVDFICEVVSSPSLVSALADSSLRAEEANQSVSADTQRNFSKLAFAFQRRLIQRQLIELGLSPNFELIESLRRSEAPVMVRPGIVVVRDSAGGLRVEEVSRACFDSESLIVTLSGEKGALCFKDVSIEWQNVSVDSSSSPLVLDLLRSEKAEDEGRGRARAVSTKGVEIFDAEKIGDSIVLRHWQAGDRFHPIGMSNAVKLQDFFVNQKVSRARRHKLLIAATANGDIFWVEGLRISERFKLDKETKKLLKWDWRRG